MAGSPALEARLFGERYGFRPAWGVTRRCLPGGISLRGERSPEGATGALPDGGEGDTVPTDRMQESLWPLLLRASATASSPAVMTTHSNNMACCQPRRVYRRRACGRGRALVGLVNAATSPPVPRPSR